MSQVTNRLFLLDEEVYLVARDSGQPEIAQELQEVEKHFPHRIRILPFVDNCLANQIHAASNFSVISSIAELWTRSITLLSCLEAFQLHMGLADLK